MSHQNITQMRFLAKHLHSDHLSYTTQPGGLLEDAGRPWTYGSLQCQQHCRERTSPQYKTLTLNRTNTYITS